MAGNVQFWHKGDQAQLDLSVLELYVDLFGNVAGKSVYFGIPHGYATIHIATGVLEASPIQDERLIGWNLQLFVAILEAWRQCVENLLDTVAQLIIFRGAFWQVYRMRII